jgi:hypothetical protein
MLAITGYIVYITYLRSRFFHDAQPKFSDLIFFSVVCLIAFVSGVYLTYLLRRLLTGYIPAWIFSSFTGLAILLYPLYIFIYLEMTAGYAGEGSYPGPPPQNWRIFLASVLTSVILFCIASTFAGMVTHLFSARRSTILGLR